jgi:hypothetical protein
MTKKLTDIQASTMNVSAADRWDKQILAVMAYDAQHADVVQQSIDAMSASITSDTIVIITATDGDDAFIYTNN